MNNRSRVAVTLLSISAAGFGAWQANEGFTDHAVIPTKGDVPTIGHGSTRYEDGRPVQMGDTITRQRAEVLARNLNTQAEKEFAASLPGVKLYQEEFDLYMDFVGQYGMGTWRAGSPRRSLLAGDYVQACASLLKYRFAAGYDCSTPGNKRCPGVWSRQLKRYSQCMGAQ
ncbi:glycoside hydrolase family protein [Pseudomonas sp. NFACC05-1]|uniref:glycoside hydrolase family protein n=1 Tax=Pseudomonas sp. NFACC05-1 TaxID=1566241 RepID=UPI0008718BD2|nr:glycoside hydrolase family protein [Pseudomonas sp. NFACC05-1]SCW91832.1 Phage-related lysozyme (muramidase), GH24 family [Pseudomonas sp. NFACC05-1]